MEVLARIKMFEKDFVVREVDTKEGKLYSAQYVYDPVCERMDFKEKKNYSLVPLTNVMNPINYSEEWDPHFTDKKNLLNDLDGCIPNHNPTLKKEYIEKVQNEKEGEIMNYVMSGKTIYVN